MGSEAAGTSMTKPDATRQQEGAPSIKQRNAIELLVAGRTDAETAEAVGVTRQTVNGWRNHDAEFLAALNARRRELWGAQEERLRYLVARAVDVLEQDLADDYGPRRLLRQAAAIHVLRSVGLYGDVKAPSGGTDAVEIRAGWEDRKRQAALFDSIRRGLGAGSEPGEG